MGNLKIIKSDDTIKVENLIVTILGYPGAGKTTTALSCDKPLLLDFDNGIQRSGRRGDSVRIRTWEDVAELSAEDLEDYNTIIVDTVGRALEVLSVSLIKQNGKLGRVTGELTLQGYGALNVAFRSFINKMKSFGKDIVLIGHAKESSQNDNTVVRIDAMGSSKDEILKCSDLLGFLEADNQGIKLNFNPTERHLGKNCAQFPLLRVPSLEQDSFFLGDLIKQAKDKINALSEEQKAKMDKIKQFNELLDDNMEAEALTDLTKLDFVKENVYLKPILLAHATKLGFIYDKEIGGFIHAEQKKLEGQIPVAV